MFGSCKVQTDGWEVLQYIVLHFRITPGTVFIEKEKKNTVIVKRLKPLQHFMMCKSLGSFQDLGITVSARTMYTGSLRD